jgi:hypothetical protein
MRKEKKERLGDMETQLPALRSGNICNNSLYVFEEKES